MTAIKWSFSLILWTFVIEQTVLVLNAFFYNRRAKFLSHFVIYTTLVADWPFDLVNWPFDLVSWPLNTIRTIRKEVKNQDIHPLYNCTTHTPEALTFTPPWFWLFPDHQQPFKLHPFIYYSIHTFGSSIILPPRFSPPNHERFHFKIEN